MVKQIVFTKKMLDKKKMTPLPVDEVLPTMDIRRGKMFRGAGAGTVIGSHFVGSDVVWRIAAREAVCSGSVARFAITHSRNGTVSAPFFPSAGDSAEIQDPYKSPIETFTQGTVTLRVLNAGTAAWLGLFLKGPED